MFMVVAPYHVQYIIDDAVFIVFH